MTDDEDRLRRALGSASGQRPADESDWAAFERRLAQRAATGRRARPRWQVPLIAAAAVAAVALATTAVATGGFGGGRQAASGSVASGPVTVPIIPPVQFSGAAGGGSGGAQGLASSPASSPGSPTAGPDPVGTVTLTFVGGKPPAATLRWLLTLHGNKVSGSETPSDGSALGYVDHTTAEMQGHRYLWGAVGPTVVQIQVGAASPPAPGDIDPGFSPGTSWTFDSGAGTAFSLPEAATARWTDLGGGWHAFAVQLPVGATTASVVALDSRGQALQDRALDLVAGTHADLPVAPNTALHQAPSPGSGTASEQPEPSVSSEAPSAIVRSATAVTNASAGCHFTGGNALGITDSGFDLSSVKFQTDPDGSGVCFFDGDSWWSLAGGRLPTELTIATTGVGTFASQVPGHPATSGRFVWGVLGSAVASVRVRVDGAEGSGAAEIHDITPTVRVFLARIPAVGHLSVAALDSRGRALQERALDLVAGTHADLPVAPNTALHQTPPPGSGTASEQPEPSVSSGAPSATVRSATLPTDVGRTPMGQAALSTPTTAAAGPTVATYQDQGIQAGMAALLEGTIRIVDGCLAIDDGSGNVLTPVFPSSQVGAAAAPAVLHFRGHDYRRGDSISLGGGEFGSTYPSLPPGCPESVWLVSPST